MLDENATTMGKEGRAPGVTESAHSEEEEVAPGVVESAHSEEEEGGPEVVESAHSEEEEVTPEVVESAHSEEEEGGPGVVESAHSEEEEVTPEVVESAHSEEEEGGAGVAESTHSMESLFDQSYDFRRLRRGDIVEGTIVRVGPGEVLIDVGSKTEGIISNRELERIGSELLAQFNVGDNILVYVVTPEDRNGNIILSFGRAQLERDWRRAEKMFEAGDIFEGTVAGYNKGGLIVRLGKVRGFVPASQLITRRLQDSSEASSGEELRAQLVGQNLQLKIIELDRERNRLILSERSAMRERRRQQKAQLLAELSEGDVRPGEVISLCDFGAFVDLGGADGLIHLSELSWRRVAHPSEVLKVGDEVEVYVLNVDRERKRIGLSLKRLQSDPWTLAINKYTVGQLVEGTVTKLVKFGAFARLAEDDIEGLIHISELSDQHVTHPKEMVKEGDVLTLRVIRVDAHRRRIGLSLKQVTAEEYAEADWQAGYEADFTGEEVEHPELTEEQGKSATPAAEKTEQVEEATLESDLESAGLSTEPETEEAASETDSESEDLPLESEADDVPAVPNPEQVTVDSVAAEPAPLAVDQMAM
ncbi:MAG: S1 RNA-binding domain-containing protein [Chloroflexota bacterium]|nr:S1 RNA-binding domain-containing protein [Chloroflexota bacterium]